MGGGDFGRTVEQVGTVMGNPLAAAGLASDSGALGNVTDAVGLSNHSGDRALEAQTNAANQANATQKYMYDTSRADSQPWLRAGTTALAGLQDPSFGKNLQMDPGYQFRLDEGNKAIAAAASARGGNDSGRAMKELTRYGQDYASNEYNNAYNRQYSRLAGLAGIGQQTNTQNAQLGSTYANNVSQNQIGLGNASAANTIGASNRLSGMIGQGIGAGMAYSDMNLKTDITEIPQSEISEMKKYLKAFAFKYKSDEFGKGDWVGVMAQDLEKSKLGRTLVVENDKGQKMIDIKKVMSMFLATMAEG